jgi:hypothetical protein
LTKISVEGFLGVPGAPTRGPPFVPRSTRCVPVALRGAPADGDADADADGDADGEGLRAVLATAEAEPAESTLASFGVERQP